MTFRRLLTLAILAFAPGAQAHLEIGTYRGTAGDGAECRFEVKAIEFKDGIRHPLNERVKIVIEGAEWTLKHQPRIDLERSAIGFERDLLSSAVGTVAGADAVALVMDHSPGHHGPVELVRMSQNREDPSRNLRASCGSLEHVGEQAGSGAP